MQIAKFPVLTYHSIDESDSVISIRAETFRAQMKFLSENNFNVVSLETLGRHLLENRGLPPKTVILCFDDGFENFYTTAFPILSESGFTATVFLVTDYCGKFNDWSGNHPQFALQKLMEWHVIKELSGYNIEFAAHSQTHPDLRKLPLSEAEREMIESRQTIENHLGRKAPGFAYPYGLFNVAVGRLAEKHFEYACSTNLGTVADGDDRFALKRIDAYYLRNECIFRAVLSGNFDMYLRVRQALRRVKSAWNNKNEISRSHQKS